MIPKELCIQHPAGLTCSATEIEQQLTQTQNWETRYRMLIKLSKQLPELPAECKIETHLIAGCESNAWLVSIEHDDLWHFAADSQARIVRGLLFVLLCALNHKDAAFIQAFNLHDYFETLGLSKHLSASRANGLQSIYQVILTHCA